MKQNILVNLILIILLMGFIFYLSKISKSEAQYVRSDLDGKDYLVQNLEGKEEAAYMLSVINEKINVFKTYLEENKNKYPDFKPYINQFIVKIKKLVLIENPPDGKYTSYTLNKGEEIALCLRSKKTGQLHDLNLIMYVVLHELAHVACPEIDHTELFKIIFIFFIQIAIIIKIYKRVNYQINPHEYCGITIRENLLNHN